MNLSKHWVAMVLGIVTFIATIFAWYFQVAERQYAERRMFEEVVQSSYQLEKMQAQLEDAINARLAQAPQNIEYAALEQRFVDLEAKINAANEQSLGLRQAINPSKPEEILTIARLTDEIKSLKKEVSSLDSDITSQQKAFQDSVLREIKSSSDSTTLILVVLLPLVLNFLYTVWKDIKTDKSNGEQP